MKLTVNFSFDILKWLNETCSKAMDSFSVVAHSLSLIILLAFTFSLIKQALRLEKFGKVIAYSIGFSAILYVCGTIVRSYWSPIWKYLTFIGLAVFTFGYVLLLYEKFKEGLKEGPR